jgi:hypothetical protein
MLANYRGIERPSPIRNEAHSALAPVVLWRNELIVMAEQGLWGTLMRETAWNAFVAFQSASWPTPLDLICFGGGDETGGKLLGYDVAATGARSLLRVVAATVGTDAGTRDLTEIMRRDLGASLNEYGLLSHVGTAEEFNRASERANGAIRGGYDASPRWPYVVLRIVLLAESQGTGQVVCHA